MKGSLLIDFTVQYLILPYIIHFQCVIYLLNVILNDSGSASFRAPLRLGHVFVHLLRQLIRLAVALAKVRGHPRS
jgi:hypothetical protein